MNRCEYRASAPAYRLIAMLFFAMAIAMLVGELAKPGRELWQAALVCAACGSLQRAWLSGFRLVIEGDTLIYRDGFFRTRRGRISDIGTIKHAWPIWQARTPSWIIKFRGGGKIAINSMVFGPPVHAAIAHLKPAKPQTRAH